MRSTVEVFKALLDAKKSTTGLSTSIYFTLVPLAYIVDIVAVYLSLIVISSGQSPTINSIADQLGVSIDALPYALLPLALFLRVFISNKMFEVSYLTSANIVSRKLREIQDNFFNLGEAKSHSILNSKKTDVAFKYISHFFNVYTSFIALVINFLVAFYVLSAEAILFMLAIVLITIIITVINLGANGDRSEAIDVLERGIIQHSKLLAIDAKASAANGFFGRYGILLVGAFNNLGKMYGARARSLTFVRSMLEIILLLGAISYFSSSTAPLTDAGIVTFTLYRGLTATQNTMRSIEAMMLSYPFARPYFDLTVDRSDELGRCRLRFNNVYKFGSRSIEFGASVINRVDHHSFLIPACTLHFDTKRIIDAWAMRLGELTKVSGPSGAGKTLYLTSLAALLNRSGVNTVFIPQTFASVDAGQLAKFVGSTYNLSSLGISPIEHLITKRSGGQNYMDILNLLMSNDDIECIILDEGFSAVDVRREREMLELCRTNKGKAFVFVTHRESNSDLIDNIIEI